MCQADKSHQGESRAASLSDPQGISELKAAKVRTSSPQVPQATEESLAKTVSQFNWKLLRVLGTEWTEQVLNKSHITEHEMNNTN